MNEETKKYLERTIIKLEAIVNSSTPWNVRDQLKAFIEKLKSLDETRSTTV